MSKFKRYERYKDSGVEWIGEIPEEWNVKKGRYFLTIYGGYAPDLVIESQNGIDYYKVDDLNQIGRQLFLECAERKIDITEEVKPVKPPVILIPKRGAAIFTNKVRISNNVCIFDSNVMGIKSGDKADIKYVSYSLLSRRLDDIADVSSIPQINNKHINVIYFPYPSIEEQTAIANFLDQKTAEIDGLIADKEKLIELLQEKRQAIITEAVTKGLNPNVRMKDSGIEWIGEVPEHWKVTKVKYFYDICLGKMIQPNRKDYSDTLEYYLCSINVTWDGIDISNLKEMWFSNDDKKKYSIKSGDLIVCEGGDAGRASIWDGSVENCYIQNAVHRVREKKNSSNKYLYYWLYFLKHAGYIDLICNKATIMHYTYEKFLNTVLIIPDLSEQQEISNYLDKKIAEINSLRKEIEWQIQKLKEYRQSLISEAVTGKIDVRDYKDEGMSNLNLIKKVERRVSRMKNETIYLDRDMNQRFEKEFEAAKKDWEKGKQEYEKQKRDNDKSNFKPSDRT